MSELNVVATIPVKDEHVEVIRGALSDLAAATRDEAGCPAYDLYESAAAPGVFVTVERWTDRSRPRRTHAHPARGGRLRRRRGRARRRRRDPPADAGRLSHGSSSTLIARRSSIAR
ncbi:putative quinol monooxygenase [Nocardioides sp. B-3]|uniref:putative quinol monooxygenase n=1 Tax=Nocardioides sp. B-3 TaxID=2895565 RepID=UPI0021528A23|nr:antibiotic biosynthesis monooxygenase [Nocardioides sp. B-3]UUZ59087.1 antibiotic biosynthesis monooxygenase [Nocardioides sp. B-3]